MTEKLKRDEVDKKEGNNDKRKSPLSKKQISERTKRFHHNEEEDDDRPNNGERGDYDDWNEIQNKKLKGED